VNKETLRKNEILDFFEVAGCDHVPRENLKEKPIFQYVYKVVIVMPSVKGEFP